MISRRNIRIKVMQALYTIEAADEQPQPQKAVKLLEKHLEQSRHIFIYLIHFITQVARYAETDAHHRSSKHLPSAQDLNVNTKIAGNEVLWKILEDSSYIKAVNEIKPTQWDNPELTRRTYLQLAETLVYKEYIEAQERNKKAEKIYWSLFLPT